MKTKSSLILLLVLKATLGLSQGFVNLNFEAANLSGFGHGIVPATNAFPGWTVVAPFIVYNDISLSGGSISITDTNSLYSSPPIQGRYNVLFRGENPNLPGGASSISLGQTGQIPLSARSIIFWGNDQGFQVTFNGQPLDFLVAGSTANYNIYMADISAYAAQTGQLLFSAPPSFGGTLDNIQFSTSPVPEPGGLALAALGTFLLGFRRWRNHPSK